jgi:hypothetical protein
LKQARDLVLRKGCATFDLVAHVELLAAMMAMMAMTRAAMVRINWI